MRLEPQRPPPCSCSRTKGNFSVVFRIILVFIAITSITVISRLRWPSLQVKTARLVPRYPHYDIPGAGEGSSYYDNPGVGITAVNKLTDTDANKESDEVTKVADDHDVNKLTDNTDTNLNSKSQSWNGTTHASKHLPQPSASEDKTLHRSDTSVPDSGKTVILSNSSHFAHPAKHKRYMSYGLNQIIDQPVPRFLQEIQGVIEKLSDLVSVSSGSRWTQARLQDLLGYVRSQGADPDVVEAILDGLYNEQLIQETDKTGDWSKLSSLRYLQAFDNPCWVEVISSPNTTQSSYFKKVHDTVTKAYQRRLLQRKVTWRMRCVPAFFLAGFPKCATTDMYVTLGRHPSVYCPVPKEIHWWARRRIGLHNSEDSNRPFSAYVSWFDWAAEMAAFHPRDPQDRHTTFPGITMDASVSTIWDLSEMKRKYYDMSPTKLVFEEKDFVSYQVSRVFPWAKIVLLVREPVDRLYSDFSYFNSQKNATELFHTSVLREIYRFRDCLWRTGNDTRTCAFWLQRERKKSALLVRLYISMYHVYIEDWLKYFPREQILVIRSEDYNSHTSETLHLITQHLGIDPFPEEVLRHVMTRKHSNTYSTTAARMPDDVRSLLTDFYRPFNERLAALLGDNKFLWSS